jgi:hypothetical protein
MEFNGIDQKRLSAHDVPLINVIEPQNVVLW